MKLGQTADSEEAASSYGASPAQVVLVCAAEVLGLAGYSLVPALLPQFIETWSLTSTEAGWMAGVMFAGYMLAVVPLVGCTDTMPARTVCLASGMLNVVACFGLALSNDFVLTLGFRALAGVALAGMYMPGLRALTESMTGQRRARVAAFYTTSFTVGASLSFLLGRLAVLWSWRATFLAAGVFGITGVMIAWMMLPRPVAAEMRGREQSWFRFDAVLQNRDAVALMIGYAAVIWGSSGLRQWIVLFFVFCAGDLGSGTQNWLLLVTAAVIGFLGVPAGLLGNELAIRFGVRGTAMVVFCVSAFATGLFGFAAMLPLWHVLLLSLAAGFVVQGNFSNLTSELLAVAAPQHAGATMAVYSAVGFGGGFVGTWVFGIALDRFGGPTAMEGWVIAFATCGLACLMGAGGMYFFSPRAARPRSCTQL